MATGRVKWFNDVKGFGFIERTGNPLTTEVFVHYTGIADLPPGLRSEDGRKSLRDGEEVEFDLYEGAKGLEARNVRRHA